MLKGIEAKEALEQLLLDGNCTPFPKPYVTGYYKSDNVFVAFDNTTADCWTEEFSSDKEALDWCSEANPNSPIIIKQLLDKLVYAEVYELWEKHVFQFSEPPELYELINQLSDLIDVDADVAKAVSDAITKEDKPEPTLKNPIIVSIRNGCIYAVDNVPSDIVVEVRDYDMQDDTSDNIHEDDDGEKFCLSAIF